MMYSSKKRSQRKMSKIDTRRGILGSALSQNRPNSKLLEALESRSMFSGSPLTAGLQPPSDAQTGAFPFAVVSGVDFNRDGKIDAAVANYASGTVSVLLGNGNGGFLIDWLNLSL